uniref:Keratin-associated protein 22-2 n=1 Tax=Capra hircus TaxID=9925 RepID=A0A290U5L2_CAPHI|nr:keratin-associated protein 22-2 [Capra hircus]
MIFYSNYYGDLGYGFGDLSYEYGYSSCRHICYHPCCYGRYCSSGFF